VASFFLIFPSRWQSASTHSFSTCFISNYHLYPFDDSSSRLYTILTMPLCFLLSGFPILFYSLPPRFWLGRRELTGEPGAQKKNNLLAERVDIVTPWVILIRRQRTLYCISTGLFIGLGPTHFSMRYMPIATPCYCPYGTIWDATQKNKRPICSAIALFELETTEKKKKEEGGGLHGRTATLSYS